MFEKIVENASNNICCGKERCEELGGCLSDCKVYRVKNHVIDWGYFSYCEKAADDCRKLGFTLTEIHFTPEQKKEIKEMSRFKSQTITIFDIKIFTSLEPGKKIHWNYNYENGTYFAESLEGALVHIIALRNNCGDLARAACKLLDVKA